MIRQKKSQDRYHHGHLRQALLTTARSILEEVGPSGLSLRGIARRLGVSAPSAYHHFSSLDAIAIALAKQGFAELSERLENIQTGTKQQLAQVGKTYIGFARDNPGLYRLMFGEGFQMAAKKSRTIYFLRQRAYAAVTMRLSDRLPAKEVPTGALFLWSLTHGLALLMIDDQINSTPDLDEVIGKVLRLASTGLIPSK